MVIITIKNSEWFPGMTMTRNRLGGPGTHLPPKKPLAAHKLSISISLDPGRRRWLRENFDRLGYRSESHMVDDLIRRAMGPDEISDSNRRLLAARPKP